MKKTLMVSTLVATGVALFVFRPWSAYSPAAMNSLFWESKRVENFRHLDRIFPARVIAAGDRPFTFENASAPLEFSYEFEGERSTLSDFLNKVSATGLLVIKNDRIVHERYMNGGLQTSTFTSWSIAKSFVSTLVGMALGDGLIESLDTPISQYVPELRGSGYDGVPIRHVLQMSSGVEFDETYSNRFSDIQQFFVRTMVLGQRADEIVPAYDREAESGTVHHYISLDTQALGMLLRRLYKRPLSELLSERIWKPLGMEADAFWNIDEPSDDGMEIAFCCINARLRDYAKLGRLYLQGGEWNGEQLLPDGWVREATTPGGPHLEPGASPYDYGPRGYGYQWWVPKDYQREYMAVGVWGQYIYVSEPDDLIIARTSVDPEYRPNVAESIAVFRAIRDALRQQEEPESATEEVVGTLNRSGSVTGELNP